MYLNLAGNNSRAQGMHHVLQMLRNNRCFEESMLFNNRMGICLERCEMLNLGIFRDQIETKCTTSPTFVHCPKDLNVRGGNLRSRVHVFFCTRCRVRLRVWGSLRNVRVRLSASALTALKHCRTTKV